jgi:hypothetical protein
METINESDLRLQPWLELATELEALDHFMRQNNLAPTRGELHGEVEFLDVGAAVA